MSWKQTLVRATLLPILPIVRALVAADRWQVRRYGTRQKAAEMCFLAVWEIERRNWGDAAFMAKRAILADATLGDGYALLGYIYCQQGAVAHARTTYLRGLEVDPNHRQIAMKLGDLEFTQGNYRDAEIAYRRALALRQDEPAVLEKLAQIASGQGRLDEAATILERLRVLSPDNADTLMQIGLIRVQQGNLDTALELFSESLKHDHKQAHAHYHQARILATLGRQESARDAVRRAIRLDPENDNYREFLGSLSRSHDQR